MVENEPFNPVAIGALRSQTEMSSPDDVPHLVEEFWLVARSGARYVLGHAPQSDNFLGPKQP
jgi:hypothetical protein